MGAGRQPRPRCVHFAIAFGAIIVSPFLPNSANALTLITNLGLGNEKVHDYPVYNLSKPYSSFGIGSNDIQLTSATFQLSTFSGFSWVTFNNMAISLYSSSSNGFVQGPSIATTYGSGEFASSTFDCPGQSNGTWAASRCKNFEFDLSMSSPFRRQLLCNSTFTSRRFIAAKYCLLGFHNRL